MAAAAKTVAKAAKRKASGKAAKYRGVVSRKDISVADPDLLVIVDTPGHPLYQPARNQQPLDEAMIRSITSLAHALHLETVAEGIERADQLAVVSGLGCTKAQGYHLARPMYPDRAEKYLLAHSPSCRGAVSPT